MEDLNVQDYNKLREDFSKSVVRIHIYRWGTNRANSKEEWLPVINLPGIVTVSGSTFCHIVACSRKFFHGGPSRYRYEVVFTDKTSVDFDASTVQESDWLVGFYVPTPGKKVDAVEFNNQNAAWQDKVWVFGYDHYSECVLDKGSATHIGDGKFGHDCPPNSYTAYGYPVFNMDKKIVGISYYDFGITHALDVEHMTYLLSTMIEEMNDKPLVEILECIEVHGEAKYGGHHDLGNH